MNLEFGIEICAPRSARTIAALDYGPENSFDPKAYCCFLHIPDGFIAARQRRGMGLPGKRNAGV